MSSVEEIRARRDIVEPGPAHGVIEGGRKTTFGTTIRIILEGVNRRGISRTSLPDGTILVGSSRQPFLDAARVLITAGYHQHSWLEGWRPGATTFALRARVGIASGLTVDETKTVFAKWKPFSSSAVASSIDHSEIPATTLAAASSALLQPLLEQQSKQPLAMEPPTARTAPSSVDGCTDQIASNFANGRIIEDVREGRDHAPTP